MLDQPDRETIDDRRDDEPAGADREGSRRRSPARDDRLCRPARDGTGGGRVHRRCLRREERRATGTAQRLPGAGLGDARRHGRAAHPRAAQGLLLSGLPGAPADGREGADCGHPGSLRPGHLDPLGRRVGQGHGDDRDLQEPGLAPVRGDRRQGEGFPRPPDRGRLALSLARRNVCEGPSEQPGRLSGGDRRGRRQQRRSPRGAGHGHRPVGSRDFLDGFFAPARSARPRPPPPPGGVPFGDRIKGLLALDASSW